MRFATMRSLNSYMIHLLARVVKLVDTGDSKSPALTGVPVRVRPLVPSLLENPRLYFAFIPSAYTHLVFLALILSPTAGFL